jgi:uncharacterized protein YegJ (DUF2314 family)
MRLPCGIWLLLALIGCADMESDSRRNERARPIEGVTATVDARGDSIWISADGTDTARALDPADRMVALARRDARCALFDLRRRLRTPPSHQTELMVKARFVDGEEVEHLWLEPISVVGDSAVRARIENDVVALRTVKYGDTVTVRLSELEDWFAQDGDTLVAGYSIRVHRSRLNLEQRARYDSGTGYVIPSDSAAFALAREGCSGSSAPPGAGT